MERFESFVNWYNEKLVGIWTRIFKNLAELALIIIVLMITVYIVLRKFTEIRIYFVEEWSAFLVVLIAYFSIAYTLRMKGHIVVDILVRHFSEMTRRVLELLTGLIAVAVASYLVQRSIAFFLYNWESGIVTQNVNPSPFWIPTLFVPLGLILFTLGLLGYTMQRLVELIHFTQEKAASPSISEESVE